MNWSEFFNTNRTFYKPTQNELKISAGYQELLLSHFKGVKPKIVKLTGDTYIAFRDAIVSLMGVGNEDPEQKDDRLFHFITEFTGTITPSVDTNKRRVFRSGMCREGLSIMVSTTTFPAPHIRDLVLAITVLEIINLKTSKVVLSLRGYFLFFDEDSPEHVKQHYRDCITSAGLNDNVPHEQAFLDMLFCLTPYKPKAIPAAA